MSKMPWWEKIRELHAELADTRATLRQSLQHRDTLRADLAEARTQIAAKTDELEHANRWISELVNNLSGARMEIAAKDAALREIAESGEYTTGDGHAQCVAIAKAALGGAS